MKFIDQLRKLCGARPADGATDALARLILAARESSEFRSELRLLLNLPEKQRAPLVLTAVEEMKMKGEPPEICAAFSILATPEGAASVAKEIDQT
mgnify:CR=1 FL=1